MESQESSAIIRLIKFLRRARTQFSKLIAAVLQGEEIVIARAGKPAARLMPIAAAPRIQCGAMKGQITVADDFDAPMPDFQDAFYNGPLFRDENKA